MKDFAEIQAANSKYAAALEHAVEIMVDRRNKYSNVDPYYNFVLVHEHMAALLPDLQMLDTFMFYISLKFARLQANNGDFEDESVVDTLVDLANYSLIAAGWLLKNPDKNLKDIQPLLFNIESEDSTNEELD